MADEQILDQWHCAEVAHARASDGDMLEAFIEKAAAENAAIARFGLGPHKQAYQARFSVNGETKP